MIQLLAAVFYWLVIQTASTIRFSRRFNFAIFDPWNETKSDYGSLKINPFAKACSDQDYLGIAKHTRQFHIFIAIYFRLDLGLARLLSNHIDSLKVEVGETGCIFSLSKYRKAKTLLPRFVKIQSNCYP